MDSFSALGGSFILPPAVAITMPAVSFRSSGACPALRRWGGAARQCRRRPIPRQYRAPDSRRHRTSVRLARSSPAQPRGRMHSGPVSHHRAEQGSTPVGGSTAPVRQRSREAAWWDGPGPALPRGTVRSVASTFTSSGWCSLNALPSPPLLLSRRRICRSDNAVFPAPP